MTGNQLASLSDMLCSAFDLDELDQVLRFRLNLDREDLVGSGNKKIVVFRLIETAIRQGWDRDLIRVYLAERPNNPLVREFCERNLELLYSPYSVREARILCVCSPQYLAELRATPAEVEAAKAEMAKICPGLAGVPNKEATFLPAEGVNSAGFRKALSGNEFDLIQVGLYVHPDSGRICFSWLDPTGAAASGGAEDSISVDEFADLIERSKAKLVIMIACDSLTVAARLHEFTSVIGSAAVNSIPEVLKWEKEFYRCLGLGSTVKEATDEANSQVKKRMDLLLKEPLAFVPIATKVVSSTPDRPGT